MTETNATELRKQAEEHFELAAVSHARAVRLWQLAANDRTQAELAKQLDARGGDFYSARAGRMACRAQQWATAADAHHDEGHRLQLEAEQLEGGLQLSMF